MSSSAFQKALSTILMMLSLLGCKEEPKLQEPPVEGRASIPRVRGNAIYHWKTVFDLKEDEITFLSSHSVRKIYVRFFDVDVETSPMNTTYSAIPIGTTTFKSPKLPNIEIVPTVFITVKSLISTKEEGIDDLASKIYTRVCNMVDYNDMGPIREIQLDCDWTGSTQNLFYSLCEKTAQLAHADSVLVSSTVRLHQLRMDPPPVDQGVLMVYNTGALRETGTKNSILDYDDVKSYLSGRSIHYDLPLDTNTYIHRSGRSAHQFGGLAGNDLAVVFNGDSRFAGLVGQMLGFHGNQTVVLGDTGLVHDGFHLI